MAGSVNKVILIGNLGKDPESKSFQNGGKVVNLRIATSESWRDKATGERKERTEWHSVAVFGNLADIVDRYVHKGSKVYIEGKLETRKWQDQSGQERYTTEIVLRPFRGELHMLDGRGEGGGGYGSDPSDPGYDSEPRGGYDRGGAEARGGFDQRRPAPASQIDDDEIPF